MWQLFYIRALEIQDELHRSAELVRLEREIDALALRPGPDRIAALRYAAARGAIWVARRLHPHGDRRRSRGQRPDAARAL